MSTQTPGVTAYIQAKQWIEIADPGHDGFLKSLKERVIAKKPLSAKQITWLIRKYDNAVNKQVRTNTGTALPANKTPQEANMLASYVINYKGSFGFMLDLQRKFNANKSLSPAQWAAVEKCFGRDNKHAVTLTVSPMQINFASPIPAVLSRKGAMHLKKKYNLNFGPFTVEILSASANTSKRGFRTCTLRVNASGAVNVCRVCGKSLVDHKSVVSGIGPVCAKNLGALYHTYKTDIQKFMADFATQCATIGVMEAEFNSRAFKDGYHIVTREIDQQKQSGNVVPVAVNVATATPAPVLQHVAPTPAGISSKPTLSYKPSSKLIRIKDNGVNQFMEFHIDDDKFRDIMTESGIGIIDDTFILHNIDTGGEVEFTRASEITTNTFKGEINGKQIFLFINVQ